MRTRQMRRLWRMVVTDISPLFWLTSEMNPLFWLTSEMKR